MNDNHTDFGFVIEFSHPSFAPPSAAPASIVCGASGVCIASNLSVNCNKCRKAPETDEATLKARSEYP